jgi:HEAT repeat protein
VQVKAVLIRSFGDSPQKNAIRKLISIARDSTSVDLRKLAVRMLGESKDPDALKFLEDLLK